MALALSLLLAPCVPLTAATVTGTLYSADGSLFTGNILFRTLRTPLVSGSTLVTGGDYRLSITNGALSTTLLAGDYRVFIGADQKGFIAAVPSGSDSYTLLSLVTNALTYTDQVYPWQSAPVATATVAGRVRTDTTDSDPVVYLSDTVDGLVAGLQADIDLISTDGFLAVTNGAAVSLTGSLTNVTVDGVPIRPTFQQTPYSVYAPSVTNRFLVNTSTSALQYNHDASIAYYGGKWWAAWNTSTNANEDQPGQINVIATSDDFVTWTAPYEAFNSATYSDNPVTMDYATDRQWQPNLLVVGSELWCLWTHQPANNSVTNYQLYFSRLASASGKWTNSLLSLNYTEAGMTFYGFQTQNALELQSGRIVAPVSWIATNNVTTTTWPSYNFFTQEKRAGVIYTDDGGVTWQVGGATTLPGGNEKSWEPVISQSLDGTIRIWVRNINPLDVGIDRALMSAVGYADGQAFSPLEYVRVETASSRLGLVQQAGTYPRLIGFQNDWKTRGSSSVNRYNLALWFGRSSRPDLTPATGFTTNETVVAYPQGVLRDGKLYVIYSQGASPRNLKTAVIDPAPTEDAFHISLRKNDYINPLVGWTNSPVDAFVYTSDSSMQAVTNTLGWGAETNVSVGAWLYRTGSDNLSIFDNRDLSNYRGFDFAIINSKPSLVLFGAGDDSTTVYTFSGITATTGEWSYYGLTIDATAMTATAYVVNAAGTATSDTVALSAYHPLGAGSGYFASSTASSALGSLVGRARRIMVIQSVAMSANNHRYWHGLAQSALGASDWAGTETSPGTAFFDFNAADGNAGSNNAAWLAAFDATGFTIRGTATEGTVDGRDAVVITGSGSASVEIPDYSDAQQFIFSTDLYITDKTSGYDQIFATIGDLQNQIQIVSRSSNATKVELWNRAFGQYQELGDYVAGQWIPLRIAIQNGRVRVSIGSGSEVYTQTLERSPRLFLGQGYLASRTLSPEDTFAAAIASTYAHISPASPYQYGDLTSYRGTNVTISAEVPRIQLVDTDSAVTNQIYTVGSSVRMSLVNDTVSSNSPVKFDLSSAQLDLIQNAPLITSTSTNGSSGLRIKVTGSSSGLVRLQNSAGTTLWQLSEDGTGFFTGNYWALAGSSGARIRSGSGVPSAGDPNGSIALRTDGTGPNLYVRENGLWIGVNPKPMTETLTASGGTLTITAGKGPNQSSRWVADGNVTLAFASLTDNDGGRIRVWPAATNVTITLPNYASGPSGTTLTVTGGTGYTNYTEIAWINGVEDSTNRVSVNALNYYR